jgi:hypothetical protein
LFEGALSESLFMPAQSVCWLVTALFSLIMFGAACRVAGVLSRGDLL